MKLKSIRFLMDQKITQNLNHSIHKSIYQLHEDYRYEFQQNHY